MIDFNKKYFRFSRENKVMLIELLSFDDFSKTGVANYYENGELFAAYKAFVPNPIDIEITQSEFDIELCQKL